MKKYVAQLLILLGGFSGTAKGQGLTEAWAFTAGGGNMDRALAVAADQNGNVYIGGQFNSPAFRIGTNYVFQPFGGYDGFVAKISSSGDLVWAQQFGKIGNEWVSGLKVGPDGSLFMIGEGIPLTKMSPDGKFIWEAGLPHNYSTILFDPDGNIYAGNYTGFVKYRPDGRILFSRTVPAYNQSGDLSIDPGGNAYLFFHANGGSITDGIRTYPVNLGTTVIYDSTGTIISVHQSTTNPRWYPAGIKAISPTETYLTAVYPTLTGSTYIGFGKNAHGYFGSGSCPGKSMINPEVDKWGNEFYAGSVFFPGSCGNFMNYPIMYFDPPVQVDTMTNNNIFYIYHIGGEESGKTTLRNGKTNEIATRLALDTVEKAVYIAGYWGSDTSRFRFGRSELLNAGGPSDVLLLKLTYQATPLRFSAGPDKSVCLGGSVPIGSPATGGGGGYTYQWAPSTGLSSTTAATPIASPKETTFYVGIVRDAAGNEIRDTIKVTVDSNLYRPTISVLMGTVPFCEGASVTLAASPGRSYRWDPLPQGMANERNILVATPGTFKVTVVSNEGCVGTSLPFVVSTLPQPAAPAITVDGPPVICGSGFKTLTAETSQIVTDFDWSTGARTSSIHVINPGTYTVRYKTGIGCWSAAASVTITAAPVVNASITPGGPISICEGDSVQLNITTASTNSVLWSTGVSGRSIWAKQEGNFSAQVSSPEGCSATTNTVAVTVHDMPRVTISQKDNILTASPAAASYQWFRGGIAIAGANSQTLAIASGGDYSVTVTSSNGCSATASHTAVIRALTPFIDYQAYPNPVTDHIHIIYTLKEEGPVSISLINDQGKLVASVISGQHQAPGEYRFTIVNANLRFQSGLYVLKIQVGNKVVTQKVVL